MTNRIDQTFSNSQAAKSSLLVCFVTAGYPDVAGSEQIINKLPAFGADVVEIGMPFSDASADGSAIRDASKTALDKGIKLKDILRLAASFRSANPDTPLILMGYFNPILNHGCKQFVADAVAAGVDGLIIVDLPPEEEGEITEHLDDKLHLIHLITPTTTKERLATIVKKKAKGFFYYVSVTGITGTKTPDLTEVAQHLKELAPPLPVAIGFGIREPRQVAEFSKLGQAVVVGSALIDSIREAGSADAATDKLQKQIASYKQAL